MSMNCRAIAIAICIIGSSCPLAISQDDTNSVDAVDQSYESLMRDAAETGRKIRSLEEDSQQRQEAESNLKEILSTAFDLRQDLQREKIAQARAELESVEKRIDERERFRDAIIKRKFEDLLAGQDLQWPSGEERSDKMPKSQNTIRPGDVVACYIEGVFPYNPPNAPPPLPPVTKLDSGGIVTGYPVVVTDDGTIQLPLVEPIHIAGLTIRQAEQRVRETYIDQRILRPERARPMLTLVPRADSVDSILGTSEPKASNIIRSVSVDPKMLEYAKRIVDRYDLNKDGRLTANEWQPMLVDPRTSDTDGNNEVTPTEYAIWMQQRKQR